MKSTRLLLPVLLMSISEARRNFELPGDRGPARQTAPAVAALGDATNLTAARSRSQDTDYAAETATMTRDEILQQAGTAILAQANQLPNQVLSLLK